MIELCAQIEQRGGQPLEPLAYKHRYLERLWTRIEHRVQGLKAGTLQAQDLVVGEGDLELRQDRLGEPGLAQGDHGLEVVDLLLQPAFLLLGDGHR